MNTNTNHDAVPEATARTDADRDRTDKAATRPGEGTGDIPDSRTRDIVTRLRRWCHAVDAESAQDLMDEAASEIERLRNQVESMRAVISADHHRAAPVSDREIREFHRRLMAMGGVPGRIWEE